MQEIISCPSCKKKLQVPEGLIGQDVQCPTCGATFTARVGGPSPAPTNAPPRSFEMQQDPWEDDDRDRNRGRDRDRDRDRDGDRRYRAYEGRRDLMPHRGSAVMTLGILSLVCTVFVCPLISVILGPIAWTMGQADMTEIRAGRMDPDGESSTNGGRICGIIGTIIGAVLVLGFCGIFGLGSMGAFR